MKSIDNTNYRYGRSSISLASAGVQKRWNLKREHSSKIDTSDFYCLPTIIAWNDYSHSIVPGGLLVVS